MIGKYTDALQQACCAFLLAPALLLAPSAPAHEIPTDVKVQLFVKPAGDHLQVLLRVPMQAMQEVEFPRRGTGLLDLARAEAARRRPPPPCCGSPTTSKFTKAKRVSARPF